MSRLFFRRQPKGVAAFHMMLGVEFIGNQQQADAFLSEMCQVPGVGAVESDDVKYDLPREYGDGPFRGKRYYTITVIVEEKNELLNIIDLIDSRCLATKQSSFA